MRTGFECRDLPDCKFWVSTRTYTAECSGGRVGEAVTVTRQARSTISQADADMKAAKLAKDEATAEIQCYFEATQSWLTGCSVYDPPVTVTRTAQSQISQEDAAAKALAEAKEGAENLCEHGVEGGNEPLQAMSGEDFYSMSGEPLVTVL